MAGSRLTDEEITDMLRQWHRMQDDPYYPSDPKILKLLLEVAARRTIERGRTDPDKPKPEGLNPRMPTKF